MNGHKGHESIPADHEPLPLSAELERADGAFIDLNRGPTAINLGGDTELRLVMPQRDLNAQLGLAALQGDLDAVRSNWKVECLIVHPSTYNAQDGVGYVQLPEGLPVTLGRDPKQPNQPDYSHGRFHFPDTVSRAHVELTREGDLVFLRDLGSKNGTYLIRSANTGDSQDETWPTWRSARGERDEGITSMAAYSKAHERHPDRNEDAYFTDVDSGAAGVFDGIGGYQGSEVAARMASEVMLDRLRRLPPKMPPAQARNDVLAAMFEAHKAILQTSKDIGTTATVAKIFENENNDKRYAVIASSGDSRAYLVHGSMLRCLTLDHTKLTGSFGTASGWMFQEILDNTLDESQLQKSILQVDPDLLPLYPLLLSAFRNRREIASCLGISNDKPAITVTSVPVMSGETLLLTTDGVTDNLEHKKIREVIAGQASAVAISGALVNAAIERSHETGQGRDKPDDMTAVAVVL